MIKPKALTRVLVLAAINLLVSLVLLETVLLVLVRVPAVTRHAPRAGRRLAQQVYRHFERSLIQFNPACAQYDPEVTYTLKPGVCEFDNVEFKTLVSVNARGVRDTDQALDAPQVIVAGDSYAMGWGVQQDEPFARVLARRSGRRVLDAGVSSYGTVREKLLLDRFDTTNLQALVIQYSDNDVIENYAFEKNGGRLPISGRAEYDAIVRYHQQQRGYYPGKYTWRLFLMVAGLEAPEPDQLKAPPVSLDDEARLFLNALSSAGHTPIDRFRIIVLELNPDPAHPRAFIAALAAAVRRPDAPPVAHSIVTLDTTAFLSDEDYYVLDDHLRARGHDAVGAALADLLRSR
jgi:hypothetical protein